MNELKTLAIDDALARATTRDPVVTERAEAIVNEVKRRGEPALIRWASHFGELRDGQLLLGPEALRASLRRIDDATRTVLERTAGRIEAFARAQRKALSDVDVAVPGGRAGHTVAPIECVGCYAPGGSYPLPSSVLMTVIPARVAGCGRVVVATPCPSDIMLAAAAIGGADGVVCAGGAHVIAALAYGAGSVEPVDLIVGPGSAWVTEAKRLVMGRVGIDALAGPSELLVVADEASEPQWVAADLLAQAEHDPRAVPMLVTTSRELVGAVNRALALQLTTLPTREVAEAAVRNGFAIVCDDEQQMVRVSDALAPEHLQIMTRDAADFARHFGHYGAIFVGSGSAEVLGDYGAGPNHVLPTSGTARFNGGLSVLSFVRVRTWLRLDDALGADSLLSDAAALARLEGLEGHARAADWRAGRSA